MLGRGIVLWRRCSHLRIPWGPRPYADSVFGSKHSTQCPLHLQMYAAERRTNTWQHVTAVRTAIKVPARCCCMHNSLQFAWMQGLLLCSTTGSKVCVIRYEQAGIVLAAKDKVVWGRNCRKSVCCFLSPSRIAIFVAHDKNHRFKAAGKLQMNHL